MSQLTKEIFGSLAEDTGDLRISIYIPTERAGDQTQQNSIRFKNQLKQARQYLAALGHSNDQIDNLLEPATQLQTNNNFWQNQRSSLALFLSEDRFETFLLADKVPAETVVSNRFHLKPLIPSASLQHLFYVLSLAEGGVNLFRGGRHGVEAINMAEGPQSLSEFLQWDDPETELQWHTQTGRLDVQRKDGGSALRGSIFHGHGAGAETEVETKNLLRFLKALDQAVYDMLAGDEQPPLVLLGSEELIGHYRKVNSYPNLIDEAVFHVPKGLDSDEIHQLAYQKVSSYFEAERQQAYQRFHEIAEDKSIVDLKDTVNAAKEGRVELLFLREQEQKWGSHHQDRTIQILPDQQPGAIDLLDLAATETLMNGGRVFIMNSDQMPGDEPVAAVLRYSINKEPAS